MDDNGIFGPILLVLLSKVSQGSRQFVCLFATRVYYLSRTSTSTISYHNIEHCLDFVVQWPLLFREVIGHNPESPIYLVVCRNAPEVAHLFTIVYSSKRRLMRSLLYFLLDRSTKRIAIFDSPV